MKLHAFLRTPIPYFRSGLCVALLAAHDAGAASNTWKGSGGADWFAPANWSLAASPTASDVVLVPNTANNPLISGGAAYALALYVGYSGTSSLTIGSGASLTTGATTIGSGGVGTILITDDGTTFTNTGASFNVGSSRTGTVTVAKGAALTVGTKGAGTIFLGATITGVPNSSGTLNIGAAAGSAAVAPGIVNAGTVTSSFGTGLVNFNHTGTAYSFGAAITGTSSVVQNAGVTILTGANTYTGPTTIKAGTLQARSSSALGAGSIGLLGGVLDLGGADALTLTLGTGANVVVSNGTLAMNILSSGSYDRLSGNGGKFTITSGILDLTGSTLTAGSYQVFTGFDAASSGGFTSILGYNVSQYDVGFSFTGGIGTLNIVAVPEPSAVPEPPASAVAISFLLGVMVLLRRRALAGGAGGS